MADYSMEYELTTTQPKKKSTNRLILVGVAVGVIGLLLGLLIGYGVWNEDGPCLGNGVADKIVRDGEADIRDKLFSEIKAENIRRYLEEYTKFPHIGGKKGENDLADSIEQSWKEQGLDYTTRSTYDVLLSYPDMDDLNRVDLLDPTGAINYTCQIREANLTADQNHPDIVPPFNAYSAPGIATADLIYVNYGRIEEYEHLEDEGYDFTGRIVIARYGKIYRGDKVKFAQDRGAAGILLFSDPADCSILGDGEAPYPGSWWMPPSGVQRGTVSPDDGDPLTPGLPAIDTAFRLNEEDTRLPTIPVHPIGYLDAEQLLIRMTGYIADQEWQGGIQGLAYKFGTKTSQPSNWKVKIAISTKNTRANTTNVFGFIRGSVEPDRYVLVGNHRDAWVFGAIDPTSGTAVMMELSRALGKMVQQGWRPRRTIVFCSWGAEEYGLVGSMEWVEHYVRNLAERAVAYLNVDSSLNGPDYVRAKGVPLLEDVLYDVAKLIETPNTKGKTLYDEWYEHAPDLKTHKPMIGGLGGGSDYKGFMEFVGVPGLDIRYTFSDDIGVAGYPLYHSSYETFYLVDKYMDPGSKHSEAIGKYWAEMTRSLSDSIRLPMKAKTYSSRLTTMLEEFEEGYTELTSSAGISLDGLKKAVQNFAAKCSAFDGRFSGANILNPLEIRMFNDQIMLLDRAFMDPEGLPDRPHTRHVLFASSTHNSYAGATFPGLVDLMYGIEKMQGDEQNQQWTKVKRHLATVTFMIDSATSTLNNPAEFC